jgi:hypothetical protein
MNRWLESSIRENTRKDADAHPAEMPVKPAGMPVKPAGMPEDRQDACATTFFTNSYENLPHHCFFAFSPPRF